MEKTIKYFISAVTAAMALVSCDFLDQEPKIISGETYYNTEQEVQYGLAGIYGIMASEDVYGNDYSVMLCQNDDLSYFNRATTSNYTQLYSHDASATEVYEAWTELYRGIKNANAFMNAMQTSEFDEDHTYYNEARFLRAYYHFLLAQGWGNVPLRDYEVNSHSLVMSAASPQFDVLKWAADEMEACHELASDDVSLTPERVTKTVIDGILARVYLFMAGESVECSADLKHEYYKLAMEHAKAVIDSRKHELNPDYSQVFINMISDQYDTQYHESMWEVGFLGDRSTPDKWSNGRIGDVLGLQSTVNSGYETAVCNYSYGQYNGSLGLWDLYWRTDRTDDENEMTDDKIAGWDKRQDWNLPPYNYRGSNGMSPYGNPPADPAKDNGSCAGGVDRTPYRESKNGVRVRSDEDPTVGAGIRCCGKWRRIAEWEGHMTNKSLYNTINFPILRYSDVLLMYAEAYNEYNGAPTEEVFNYVKSVRDRAGIQTRPYSEYSGQEEFRQLVRNERGRELCFEGTRKFDLIRWGIFVESVKQYLTWADDSRFSQAGTPTAAARNIGANVAERHQYFPIPAVELGVNKQLSQNPLW